MKKIIGGLLSVIMLLACITGCGKSASETIRVGSLKGPTSIGLLELKDMATNGGDIKAAGYEFTMATAADEITTALVKGELDIALIPANVASVLYNKTEGGVVVIDINTLSVLYMVSGDTTITNPTDLEGKTVYLTGKGTTPDYLIQFILGEYGLTDKVTLEYKSEATEVAAVLASDESAVGILPQPFVTAACAQNDKLAVIMDLSKVFGESVADTDIITGVTVARKEFVENHPEDVKAFVEDHGVSAAMTESDLEKVAALAVSEGIIPSEPVAMKAIPACNITCITGTEMEGMFKSYLQILYDMNPEVVGGNLPGDDFYLPYYK